MPGSDRLLLSPGPEPIEESGALLEVVNGHGKGESPWCVLQKNDDYLLGHMYK